MKTIANLNGSPLSQTSGEGSSLLVTDNPTNNQNNREIKYIDPEHIKLGTTATNIEIDSINNLINFKGILNIWLLRCIIDDAVHTPGNYALSAGSIYYYSSNSWKGYNETISNPIILSGLVQLVLYTNSDEAITFRHQTIDTSYEFTSIMPIRMSLSGPAQNKDAIFLALRTK